MQKIIAFFSAILLVASAGYGQNPQKTSEPFELFITFKCDKSSVDDHYPSLEQAAAAWFRQNAIEDVRSSLVLADSKESPVRDPDRYTLIMILNYEKDGKTIKVDGDYKTYSQSGDLMQEGKTNHLVFFSGPWTKYENFREGLVKSLEKYSFQFQEVVRELAWKSAVAQNSTKSFQSFLDTFPSGKYSEDAKLEIEAFKRLSSLAMAKVLKFGFLDRTTSSFVETIASVDIGDSIPMSLNLFQEVSYISSTPNVRFGKVPYGEFTVRCTNCAYSSGLLTVANELSKVNGNSVKIEVLFPQSGAENSISIPIAYRGGIIIDFSGNSGAHGEDGVKGHRGSIKSRSTGATLLGSLSVGLGGNGPDGEDGGPGSPGEPGMSGEPGENARDIDVFVTYAQEDDREFLKGQVSNGDRTEYFKVDISKGGIKIRANGGNGGNGGEGGKGGDGADGVNGEDGGKGQKGYILSCEDGKKGGNGGRGGDGGDGADGANGGDSGNGGDGATVRLVIDPSAAKFQNLVSIESNGGRAGRYGRGGAGGRPGREGRGGNGGKGGLPGTHGSNCKAVAGQSGNSGTSGRSSNVQGRNGTDGNTGIDGRQGNISAVKKEIRLNW